MKTLFFCFTLIAPGSFWFAASQPKTEVSTAALPVRWQLSQSGGIIWRVTDHARLPHQDHLEMSGRKVSVIVQYGVDANRNPTVSREVYWPALRLSPKPGEPEWYQYRAYLKRTYGNEIMPEIRINGKPVPTRAVRTVEINGVLTIVQEAGPNLSLKRIIFPSTHNAAVLEKWELTNTGKAPVKVAVSPLAESETENGIYGKYVIETQVKPVQEKTLAPGKRLSFGLTITARKEAEKMVAITVEKELAARQHFVGEVTGSLVLTTPDSVLNRAFRMAKIRASESVFETKSGLMHSPGGGRYYAGVWANDQVEYAGPFFPFLGYDAANQASLNAYRIFAKGMKPDYKRIWASYEMEGDLPCCSKDRGDAAMYAYGAARFALASGNAETGKELWPAVAWALEYCRRHTNADGVVESESDEMEGRLPTGKANLSTSSLTYGGLLSGARLARATGNADSALVYEKRAEELKAAIERHFGATVEGFRTYRYFQGHDTLRHWICLPLVMGITERKEGTLQALFTRLWTYDHGLAVHSGAKIFWDRGTLYALRGAFTAGEPDLALRYLKSYTAQRLTGDHVPYPVEAYPEGGQAHLSAESALYCRVFTEGLFGVEPIGFGSFRCTPRLPAGWPSAALSKIKAFGEEFDLIAKRESNAMRVQVLRQGKPVFDQIMPEGSTFEVKLKREKI